MGKRLKHFVITKLDGKNLKEGNFKPFEISKYNFMKIKQIQRRNNGKSRTER